MKYFLLTICCLVPFVSFAQPLAERLTPTQNEYQHTIRKTTFPVTIDGKLDEDAWKQAAILTDFWVTWPYDDRQAKQKTEARITFDDKNIYVAFAAYDSGASFVSTLKRDGGHDGSDGVAVIIDPMNKHANGFFFVVNAFNSQSEDQLGGSSVNFSWDQKWFSQTHLYADRWEAEMAIPFKSLRYDQSKPEWGINFLRVDTRTTEYSLWTRVPFQFDSHDLGYTGLLKWEELPPPPGNNMVFVPYVTAQGNSQQTGGKNDYSSSGNAGFDAKIALSSSLNLDLTVNPDFSQVEVDQQVTNLTRFNIFFPERRNFFLENADLFTEHGLPPIRPFYSRRIGLDKSNNPIPILGGLRLTGNATPSTRFGLLSMQTGNKGNYRSENYSAFTLNQRVFKRSLIKSYFLNREGFLNEGEKNLNPLDAYGRNFGTEFKYISTSGELSAWLGGHKSLKRGISTEDHMVEAGFKYSKKKFGSMWDFTRLGTNFYTDMGYTERIDNYDALRDTTIRLGYSTIYNENSYTLFPGGDKINAHKLQNENRIYWNPDGSLNERSFGLNYEMEFRSMSRVEIEYLRREVHLLFPTSFTKGEPIPADDYRFGEVQISVRSNYRKPFSASATLNYGGFYNGTYTGLKGGISIRSVPNFRMELNANYYNIQLPDPHGSAHLLLISPRFDLNFTTSLFWTTFLQFNTQNNNFNINSRFQWRFRPMSDFYLVYTDNYFTDPFLKNKNRGLVMKLNYWLNL